MSGCHPDATTKKIAGEREPSEQKKENRGIPRNGRKEGRHSMPGKRRKKTAEYRGEQNIRKRRDVDVRNANEMRTVEEANKRLINQ